MNIRFALVLSIGVALVSSSAFAQSRPKSYDPALGVPPAAVAAPAATTAPAVRQMPGPDQRAAAQQRLAAWTSKKEQCLTAAGLEKGKHFRVSPDDPTMVQVHDKVWLMPDRFNLTAIEACR